MTSPDNYRVILAHRILPTAVGLEIMINQQERFEVVGRYATHQQALASSRATAELAVLDYAPEHGRGLSQVKEAAQSGLPFLLLGEDISSRETLLCLQHKATGYLSLEACENNLSSALFAVANQQTYVEPQHIAYLLKNIGKPIAQLKKPFTPREEQVMQLLVRTNNGRSMTVKQIAENLKLSVKTVEVHKYHLMQKAGVHTRLELVEFFHGYNSSRI